MKTMLSRAITSFLVSMSLVLLSTAASANESPMRISDVRFADLDDASQIEIVGTLFDQGAFPVVTLDGVPIDVTDASAIESSFASVRKDLGEVDVLVYNAGAGTWGNIEGLSAADFERSWRINTMGAFLTTREVIGPMVKKGGGSIVVVGATASLRGKPFTTGFASATRGFPRRCRSA